MKGAHSEVSLLLLTGRSTAVGHAHVLSILEGSAVEEQYALGCLLVLQTVQDKVHPET